jgi:dipeptidyl aminopeptidase/acylaminoacyl peptidase
MLLCVVLVACSDDDSGRRFANEPPPTADANSTATISGGVQVTPTPTTSTASPVAVPQLLAASGGVSAIVVQIGDELVAASPPWTNPRIVWSAAKERLLAYTATPNADSVALVLAPDESATRIDLVLLGADGKPIRRIDQLGRFVATPSNSDVPAGEYRLSWSPDGSQVLAGLATGGILAVPRTGEPQVLVGPARAPAPGQVSWSPRGNAIAFISPAAPKLAGGLYVAPTGAVPLDPVPVVPPSAGGRSTVSRFAWSPDGATLYYTVASTTGDPSFGGDLFRVPAAGGTPTLVATASRAGPVSAITNFAISPDGAGAAYVITVPADNGQPTDSLWLQPIGTNEAVRLPLAPRERVTGLWWTTDGLIWSASPAEDAAELILYRANDGEAPGVVYRGSVASGTPVAAAKSSPEASPAASPVAGSPAAD